VTGIAKRPHLADVRFGVGLKVDVVFAHPSTPLKRLMALRATSTGMHPGV